MKIILKEDVRDLGRSGEVVEVKEGYARNFLLPKKLAVQATPGYMKDLSKRIEVARQREERERMDARNLGDRLRELRVTINHRAAEGSTRLHGSVTSENIADAVRAALGTDFDRRTIDMKNPIRTLGEHQVTVRLLRGMSASVTVVVQDPTQVPEEPAAPAAEEAQPEAAPAA